MSMYYISFDNQNRQDTKIHKKSDSQLKVLITTLLMIGLLYFFITSFCEAIDKTIRNQDIMLCDSALISRNKKYLKKCQCYYDEGEIECLEN